MIGPIVHWILGTHGTLSRPKIAVLPRHTQRHHLTRSRTLAGWSGCVVTTATGITGRASSSATSNR